MFLAKFQQVTSDKFNSDKNNNKPFIGEVLAGTATGSIINGTIFVREGLESNVTYACTNYTETYEGEEYTQTRIIGKVPLAEFHALETQLGKGQLSVAVSANATADAMDDKHSL